MADNGSVRSVVVTLTWWPAACSIARRRRSPESRNSHLWITHIATGKTMRAHPNCFCPVGEGLDKRHFHQLAGGDQLTGEIRVYWKEFARFRTISIAVTGDCKCNMSATQVWNLGNVTICRPNNFGNEPTR